MLKRFAAAAAVLLVFFSFSSCNVKDDEISEVSVTVKETRVHNNFKDVLPKPDFDGEISESYDEGIKYSFNVKCSEKECEKYIKQLKKAGFVERATETKNYYTAVTEDGYFVEMTYINGNLTVYTKKIA